MSNRNYIEAKKLKLAKYRRERGLFLCEGDKLVRDAVRFGLKPQALFVTADKLECFENADCPVFEVSERMLGELSDTVTPQGVVGVFQSNYLSPIAPQGNAVLLDNIQDPRNVGAILRCAAAFGYSDVYIANGADVFSLKCLRSGMSAQFVLRIYDCTLDQAFDVCGDCLCVCADMDGQAIDRLTGLNGKHLLVIGSEGQGVSDEALKRCELKVGIPMLSGIESLNAAVSAGIIMYALTRG